MYLYLHVNSGLLVVVVLFVLIFEVTEVDKFLSPTSVVVDSFVIAMSVVTEVEIFVMILPVVIDVSDVTDIGVEWDISAITDIVLFADAFMVLGCW